MDIAERVQRFGQHRNAFGFLRLLLATLVIVSHVPEVTDGDRRREILTRLVGTVTFGGVAVDGFFILSGFLIAGSFLSSRSTLDYLAKRVARIYPAFVAASLVCVLVVAPLAGGHLVQGRLRTALGIGEDIVLLGQPMVPGVFAGTSGALLMGAAWTIQYEFACYLLVIALGVASLLRRGWLLAAAAAALLVAAGHFSGRPGDPPHPWGYPHLFQGAPRDMLRLPGMFLAGTAFNAFRHRLTVPWPLAGAATAALAVALIHPATAEPGLALFGGYLLFAAARAGRGTVLERINNRNDISYGLYLYAWPAQKLLFLLGVTALLPLGVATWLVAAALGWLSWRVVEQPALRRVRAALTAAATRRARPDLSSRPRRG